MGMRCHQVLAIQAWGQEARQHGTTRHGTVRHTTVQYNTKQHKATACQVCNMVVDITVSKYIMPPAGVALRRCTVQVRSNFIRKSVLVHPQTDRQTETDRQTGRQADGQTDRQTDRHKHTNTQTHKHTNTQTHKHQHTHTHTPTNTHTHTPTHTDVGLTPPLTFSGEDLVDDDDRYLKR